MRYLTTGSGNCPCQKCQKWYDSERLNTAWLTQLNSEIPCPCGVSFGAKSVVPTDQPTADWKSDDACPGGTDAKPGACGKFHPGSAGCLRSVKTTSAGAGQQCCFDSTGTLLVAGTPGAGTPDKEAGSLFNWYDHLEADVIPYLWCCSKCNEGGSYCNHYIDDLRKGDNSHCP